ncbi:hypothetical protein BD410DRAFT_845630 [Rickenella mellea]|uniref:Ubiquitin-like domain-containing protein n=1 Tax=Rickenella mellea TaxID=50990 RepID=A0A4Y7PKF9_9AGAM|nr:hypothetical protein BD410DRAFT_845630 [Rickenella mellea]
MEQIFVEDHLGKRMGYNVRFSNPVYDLKQSIEALFGNLTGEQSLEFNSKEPQDSDILASYSIQPGDVVQLSGKTRQVFVKTLTGKTLNYSFDPDDPILLLAAKIHADEGIPIGFRSTAFYLSSTISVAKLFSAPLNRLTNLFVIDVGTLFVPRGNGFILENLRSLNLQIVDQCNLIECLSRSPRLEELSARFEFSTQKLQPIHDEVIVCLEHLRYLHLMLDVQSWDQGRRRPFDLFDLPALKTFRLHVSSFSLQDANLPASSRNSALTSYAATKLLFRTWR